MPRPLAQQSPTIRYGALQTMSMSGPQVITLKRRRTEEPPNTLIRIEPDRKRPSNSVHYVRRIDEHDAPTQQASLNTSRQDAHEPSKAERVFELHRTNESLADKKGHGRAKIATVVERKEERRPQGPSQSVGAGQSPVEALETRVETLKKPSRRAAVRITGSLSLEPATEDTRRHVESLAECMHQAALEEVKREAQPAKVAVPKLSAAKSRERHMQRAAQYAAALSSRDVHVEDEMDYVYDTYILAPSSNAGTLQMGLHDLAGNVGYLIITEEDQDLWDTYLEEEQASDKDWDSAEDDENAEDYYGADYPEDEVASEDEFDQNAYGFRARRGSEDEEWNEDIADRSDDASETSIELNRPQTAKQFAKYMQGH